MSTRISACTVRLAMALLCAGTALPSSVGAANWQVTTVNGAAYTGRSSAITVGSDGVAHIGYWDVLAGVQHAWWTGSAWANELVESPPTSLLTLESESSAGPARAQLLISVTVAAASLGSQPVLVYSHGDFLGHSPVYGPIRVAIRGPSGWSIESIPGAYAPDAAVTVDPLGVLHVVYSSNGQIMHARKLAGGWQVLPTGLAGEDCAITIETPADYALLEYWPRIAYVDGVSVRVAQHTNGGWASELIDAAGSSPSIAAGVLPWGTESLHLVYGTSAGVRHAARQSSTWVTDPVAGPETSPGVHGIAVDGAGRPSVVFSRTTAEGTELHYARREGSEWLSERVDSVGNTGLSSAIALDPAMRPWISYHRDDLDCMMAAHAPAFVGVDDPDPAPIAGLRLRGAHPLRTGQSLRLAFTLPAPDAVTMECYDVSGRRRASIGPREFGPGAQEWSSSLALLTPGLYLVRATGRAGEIGSVRVLVTR